MQRARWSVSLFACGMLLAIPAFASAQGLGALRRKAEEAKEAKKKLDALSEKKPATDSTKKIPVADTSKKSGPADTARTSPSASTSGSASAAPASASAKVWENYDFVPGNKVIFFSDFSEDKVGNFARGLKYASGTAEVVERDGAKVLRSTSRASFFIPVGKKLPQRFTLEFDVISPSGRYGGDEMVTFSGGVASARSDESAEVLWHPNGTAILGSGLNLATGSSKMPDALQDAVRGHVAHVRVLMDSGYFKMYSNERRMHNIPELRFMRDSVIRMTVVGGEGDNEAVYITSIRVAESETDVLYDALASKGRWSTHGILFATGKAELQPESRPVLKEIAAALKDHATLKILIEGHTDNVGAPATNLSLSDARAAAVKSALVSDFGIAADRITTRGLGDTKPAALNTTAVGRAQNRRVEVVKQ